MKSYGQLCALAKALDVIGDRWALLIVRELMLGGPRRYTDLLHGLPGIATNLLAGRLRQLEQAGVIRRDQAPPPTPAALFSLTPRGQDLRPVIDELGRWGAPLLAEAGDDDVFRSHWMTLPLELYYYDTAPGRPPVTIEVRTADQPMVITTADGKVHARPGTAKHPDAILSGPPRLIIAALSGRLDLDQARERGLQLDGDPSAVTRIRSASAPAPPSRSTAVPHR
jgi:DNA-binding HxlR family transcriptional regulator